MSRATDQIELADGVLLSVYTSKGRKAVTYLPPGPWIGDDAFLRAQLIELVSEIVENGETLCMDTFEVSPNTVAVRLKEAH